MSIHEVGTDHYIQ